MDGAAHILHGRFNQMEQFNMRSGLFMNISPPVVPNTLDSRLETKVMTPPSTQQLCLAVLDADTHIFKNTAFHKPLRGLSTRKLIAVP